MTRMTQEYLPGAGLPRFVTLEKEQVERIHDASLHILENVGIILQHEGALSLVEEGGARVDRAAQRAWLPPKMVEEALERVPRSFVLSSGGDEGLDARMGVDGGIYTRPAGGLDFIIDAGQKRRRKVTLKDAVDWARLVHRLPHISVCNGCFPWDVPLQSREVRVVQLMLQHTDKPLMISGLSGEGMRWIGRLLEAVPTERGPRAMVLSSVNSPLIYGQGQINVLLVSAEIGIPVNVNSSAVAGATSPVTMAGTLVVMNAEMLAAIVLAQLRKPGAPVVYAGHPLVMDMKTGLAAFGYAEAGLIASACIDLGRFYGLPTGSDGVQADSPIPDANAAIDKFFTGYAPFMAGANINAGAGSLAALSTVSLEQLVIDDDIYARMYRHLRGIRVDEESLAFDVIARVGPSGHYLGDKHTVRHFREEYELSLVANRLNAAAWEERGARDVVEVAHDRVMGMLEGEPEPVLPAGTVDELGRIMGEAERAMKGMELPT